MAKNRVQFQKDLSFDVFMDRYGTEEACHAALFAWRWRAGFICPECGFTGHCRLQRNVYQCNRCKHQTSVSSGTLFRDSKLPLRTWFLALVRRCWPGTPDVERQLGASEHSAGRNGYLPAAGVALGHPPTLQRAVTRVSASKADEALAASASPGPTLSSLRGVMDIRMPAGRRIPPD